MIVIELGHFDYAKTYLMRVVLLIHRKEAIIQAEMASLGYFISPSDSLDLSYLVKLECKKSSNPSCILK